jgi:AcrR family transcriptional regulator
MTSTLRGDPPDGLVRSELDVGMVADMLCQAMLHVGLGLFAGPDSPREIAAVRCQMMLRGIAKNCPSDATLDSSPAMATARDLIAGWMDDEDEEQDEAAAVLRAAARSEVARRGYQATTIRDIASTAGISSHSAIFRRFRTKDELLASITESFSTKVRIAWRAVLDVPTSGIDKLDALIWIDLNLIERFRDEFNALQAHLRESPPSKRGDAWQYPARMRDLQILVQQALRDDEFASLGGASSRLYTKALADFVWMPDNLVARAGGARPALRFARSSALRGSLASSNLDV